MMFMSVYMLNIFVKIFVNIFDGDVCVMFVCCIIEVVVQVEQIFDDLCKCVIIWVMVEEVLVVFWWCGGVDVIR